MFCICSQESENKLSVSDIYIDIYIYIFFFENLITSSAENVNFSINLPMYAAKFSRY